MASVNTPQRKPKLTTHEGGPAYPALPHVQQLRRSVMSCLLWEREFYEDSLPIADRIVEEAEAVSPFELAAIAVEARNEMHLRHVPLLLLRVLVKTGRTIPSLVEDTFPKVIQRADELTEFMAIYWKDGKTPIAAGAKRGLARAFANFDEYQLKRYKGEGVVRLRDVMFMTHPNPENDHLRTIVEAETQERKRLFTELANDTASSADTWETALSGGADKKATFERLITEGRLGYLALLRNLKGMAEAGVDHALVAEAIRARKGAQNVLPFRYIAALRAAPQFVAPLDAAFQMAARELKALPGLTVVLVDVSGSMSSTMSAKSDMKREDAACALAVLVPGEKRVFSFSNICKEVPVYAGLAGIDAIRKSQENSGTYLGKAVQYVNDRVPDYDRLVVITDEQSADKVIHPLRNGYMLNVASSRNGVGYGAFWTHIDGFSENVLAYIATREQPVVEG